MRRHGRSRRQVRAHARDLLASDRQLEQLEALVPRRLALIREINDRFVNIIFEHGRTPLANRLEALSLKLLRRVDEGEDLTEEEVALIRASVAAGCEQVTITHGG